MLGNEDARQMLKNMAWKARVIATLDNYAIIKTDNIYLADVLTHLKRMKDLGFPISPIITSGTMSKLKKVLKEG